MRSISRRFDGDDIVISPSLACRPPLCQSVCLRLQQQLYDTALEVLLERAAIAVKFHTPTVHKPWRCS